MNVFGWCPIGVRQHIYGDGRNQRRWFQHRHRVVPAWYQRVSGVAYWEAALGQPGRLPADVLQEGDGDMSGQQRWLRSGSTSSSRWVQWQELSCGSVDKTTDPHLLVWILWQRQRQIVSLGKALYPYCLVLLKELKAVGPVVTFLEAICFLSGQVNQRK